MVLIVIGGNNQNGYIPEGTRLKTTLNCRGYSIPLKIRVIKLGLFYLSFAIEFYKDIITVIMHY